MNKKIEVFEEYSIPKALIYLALPTILGMLVNIFYNMVDTFFVGQTKDPNQVAAVSLTMPIYLLLMSFGSLYGVGGASYISRSLGSKNYDTVKNTSSFVLYASIFTGIISTIVFLIFMPQILKLSGASNETHEFSKSYLTIIAFGSIFVISQLSLGQIVRAEGSAKEAMIGMVIGTVVNIILDPIMILYMNMGVAGAALATIIGNACSTFYYIWYINNKSSFLSSKFQDFKLKKDVIINVIAIGTPVSINNVLISIANVFINNYATKYGNNVVAGLGISMRVFMLVLLIFIGLGQGIQPFLGYNYASKNYKRMNGAIKISCLFSFFIGIILLSFIWIFARDIVRIFINNEEVIEYGSQFLIAAYSIAPIFGFQFVFISAFQSFGKYIPSLILSLSRQGFAFIPAVIIGTKYFGLNGIMWAQPVADIFSIILATIMYLIIYINIKKHNNATSH